MRVNIKGSYDIFRNVCKLTSQMATEYFSKATDHCSLENEFSQILSDLDFAITFWPYEVDIPKEHFEIFSDDDSEEEYINFFDEDPYNSLMELFMILVIDIVDRHREMREREIDFENNNVIIVEPIPEVEVA